ncbi:hypothetical protein QBC46DRAFT_406700 [Diplogelasinospora grovesii]|uniref:Uncharacterized protein n=1 Tax=Diplogelasinospora grovesii TaxID=303347 RepID=A0AAN6S6V1_9PEZI|nr:hypothetical protein QBC46DRAFT_406700 [Diplogelasinospora grovesii]
MNDQPNNYHDGLQAVDHISPLGPPQAANEHEQYKPNQFYQQQPYATADHTHEQQPHDQPSRYSQAPEVVPVPDSKPHTMLGLRRPTFWLSLSNIILAIGLVVVGVVQSQVLKNGGDNPQNTYFNNSSGCGNGSISGNSSISGNGGGGNTNNSTGSK